MDEVLDTPYMWHWLDATHALFSMPDGEDFVVGFNSLGLGCWETFFGAVQKDEDEIPQPQLQYHLTGSHQNPIRLYSTVVAIINKFMEENSGSVQSIRAEASDKRMMGVYQALIQRKVDQKYFHITTSEDGYILIVKKHPSEIDSAS